jgi:hypothetical protein
MKTPIQYKNMLAALGIDPIKTEDISSTQAQERLVTLADIQTQIKDIETSLNLDMHALRSQYHGRLASLNQKPKRKGRAGEEQLVEDKRDAKLAPYGEVRAEIQTLLANLEEQRSALEKLTAGA